MAQQLDEAGGALLSRMIGDLGIAVHIGVGTEASSPHNEQPCGDPPTTRCGSRSATASVIDAGVVVFAAGVRPRDELARDAGLRDRRAWRRAHRLCPVPRAIPTSTRSARSPRSTAAATAWSGPGYTSAEVVADRLLGGAAEFGEADMSTKLKLLGVDVASFGDAHGRHAGLPRGRGQRRRQPDLRQAGALRRRQDAARRHPGRRRVGLRRAAADGRRAAARRPAGADRTGRIRRRRLRDWVSARCRPPRRSARATTSPRAISPTRSPAAAPTCPP